MSDLIEERLRGLGIKLPEVHTPGGALCAVIVHGGVARTSGQLPRAEGVLTCVGRVGEEVSVEEAVQAARLCTLNGLAALRAELGTLDGIERVLAVTGYVACVPGFSEQPAVVDGASNLLVEVFDRAGVHTRSAIGVAALPRGAAVEIELSVALRQG